MKVRTVNDLEEIKKKGSLSLYPGRIKISVGTSACGLSVGAGDVLNALSSEVKERGLNVEISQTGCLGLCHMEPMVKVSLNGGGWVYYGKVTPKIAQDLVTQIAQGNVPEENAICKEIKVEKPDNRLISELKKVPLYQEHSFFRRQLRLASGNVGLVNPWKIEEYVATDGYYSLYKALTQMSPQNIINEVKDSALRGRGGAGFPTGLKWEFARKEQIPVKFFICNADEGDPGAYKDRIILEGEPHRIIEAMVIGGYAVGANEGFIYLREEYPLAHKILAHAIKQAHEYGFIGRDIFGSGFDFMVWIYTGAGSYICGEETALMDSIEGKIGDPRFKPPFPVQKGLWQRPSVVNNVETLANIPLIIARGGAWYAGIGTTKSTGTKMFCLIGSLRSPCLIEVPMGTNLQEVVTDIGGGALEGKKLKAIQPGSPFGGFLPLRQIDIPLDFEHLEQAGSMLGSGVIYAIDNTSCMVDIVKFLLEFFREESCGKCVPCREGLDRMIEIIDRIALGQGKMEDLALLETLSAMIKKFAFCPLGGGAPDPFLTSLKHFRDEYETHITKKVCPAKVYQTNSVGV